MKLQRKRDRHDSCRMSHKTHMIWAISRQRHIQPSKMEVVQVHNEIIGEKQHFKTTLKRRQFVTTIAKTIVNVCHSKMNISEISNPFKSHVSDPRLTSSKRIQIIVDSRQMNSIIDTFLIQNHQKSYRWTKDFKDPIRNSKKRDNRDAILGSSLENS